MAKQISTARKVGRVVKTVLKSVVAVLLVALLVINNAVLPGIYSGFKRMADNILGYEQGWDNSGVDAEGLDLDYYKTDYTTDTIKDAEKALDQQIAAEGYVLLQNEGDSLPLEKGTTLSFFGESVKSLANSQNMLTMVTGSSSDTSGLESALEAHGLSVNQELLDFYMNGAGKDYTLGVGSIGYGTDEDFSINECPLSVLQDAGVLGSAEGTTPVFVLRRVAGEGRDMPRSMYNHADNPEDQVKTYLEPDSTELEILQYLNDNFDNTVLIVNTASALDLDFLEDMPNIKSVLFVPSAGTYGLDSLAGILAGDINPSARTADTFSGKPLESPAAQNYGDYEYVDKDGNRTNYNYITYAEGIYVGYKYYETRYEDAVMGTGNAGDYDYSEQVTHPFGFGLSYTTFDWSGFSTSWDGDECTATVTVTNTGDVAGKDVVELYAQSPYTDYDRANGVEKASVVLVGFAKTDVLEPGVSQTVEITFDESQLKSYDENNARTYILDAGTYYVTAGRDAHDAVNNVLAAKGYTTADGMTADGNAALVATYVPDNAEVDTTTYATDTRTGEQVTNRFDAARGDAGTLTRADWVGTFPVHDGTPLEGTVSTWGNEINGEIDGQPASLLYIKEASDELLAQLESRDSGNPDIQSWAGDMTYGADNGLELVDMRGLSYDDPQWDALLDQLTPEDYNVSIGVGGYGTQYLESVQKPFNVDADTAAGLIYGGTGMQFCTPVTVTQTWNQEIYSDYGEMIGNEALLGGATGWYAPSMNIHRTPFTGRNGEYYSEDGFLSGLERHTEVVNAWTECTDLLATEMLAGFAEDNPIYMMADSGARGSKTQLRQLAGMRGLMADMSGDTIDLPIKANFREGLEPLEYFISTYGARKGLVDTASHTSDSGYLTRRLVDVAQDVIVREEDCGTDEGVTYPLIKPGQTSVDTDLIGRCALNDICDPATGEVLIAKDAYVESKDDLEMLVEHGLKKVELRALLTCKSKYGVCQKCYGWDLSTRRPVNIGTAVGIIAAQSIGEPGTQLTMRTIHSGGVAGADDITQGLPTVARMFDVVGNVNEKILGREADLAPVSGLLRITPEQAEYLLRIVDPEDQSRVIEEWRVPASVRFMPGVEDNVEVRAGDQITRGFVNFRKLRRLTDIESTMHTFVESVKDVYTSQGVDLNDKHIEVIARQMLRRVQVTNPGDSQYLLGQYVDRYVFADTVRNVTLAGGTPPEAEPVILGTLKVASSIDSWLSSASFIRTAGVLTEAAIEGDVDHLLDLKSNVIVGKQIPAGTGLDAYNNVELTYHGTKIDGPTSPLAKSLPEWAPDELKGIEEQLPKQLDWVGDDYGFGGVYSKNGRTLSSEDAKLYLFDDLGVSQRWTNKFSEVGIETVGDLIGKTEDDLLRIDGIGAKAIEELRDGLEARGLLYILEPDNDEADSEDLSQLLNMVFSPDADADIMLGTAAPSTHHFDDDELIGGTESAGGDSDIINEDLGSLDDLLSQVVRQESEHDGE